jgi:hypothetical protein
MAKRTRAPKQPQNEAWTDTPRWIARYAYWLIPLVLFLVVRLFSGEAYYQLGGDQCTFLELGRTFPKHQLFNHELYLIHPPLFGYVIGMLQLFLPLLAAGLAATLLFACISFIAITKLGQFDNLPRAAISVGLIYLSLNRPAVAYDYHVARVAPLVAATALALLAFLRLVRQPSRAALVWAIAANVVCLTISDQALLLIPCEALILFSRGASREWKWWVPLGAASVAAALVWPTVRLIEFCKHSDLPAGIDGTIEFTKNFPLMAAIQPNFLPFTNAHRSLFTQTSLSLANIKPALLFSLPPDLLLIPRGVSAGVVLLLIAAALTEPGRRRRAIQWLILSLFFLIPAGLGMNEWYGMGFIVPFALLVMEGATVCFSLLAPYVRNIEQVAAAVLSLACAVGAALWFAAPAPEAHDLLSPRGGTHFLFARPPITHAATVAVFFAKMPRDTGIMAPQGLSPEIVYLTDKRVVALPFDPGLLDRFIEEYKISYLVTSSEHMIQYNSPIFNLYTSRLVTRFIVEHPERYRLVQQFHEDYPAFYNSTEYYVFQMREPAGIAR